MVSPSPPPPKKTWLRLVVLAVVILLGVVLLRAAGLHHHIRLEKIRVLAGWVGDLGWIGPVAYVLLWVVACLFFLPGLPITLVGAAVFGAWWGMVWTTIGANLGAQAAFLAGRYAARGLVEDWAVKNPQFRKLDDGVARHGWRMVMITRLVPLFPFNFQNYAYGLTKIRYATYAGLTLLCMIPGTAAYTLAGGSLVSGGGDIKKTLIYLAVAAVFFVLISFIPGLIKKKYTLDRDR